MSKDNMGQYDGNGKDKNGLEDNIVSLSDHKKRKKPSNKPEISPSDLPLKQPSSEPFITLPKGVQALLGLLLFVHIGLWGLSQFSTTDYTYVAILNWGFIPARFSGDFYFLPITVLTPITYALFHGGWLHIIMNSVMLMAFGSGFEKIFGVKKMMIVFWGSTVIAALVHFLLDPHSMSPMIGASGGVSGLFAGMILVMHKTGRLGPSKRLFPVIAVFVGISVVFGFMGGPDGSIIAWAAHIGGFLGGLGIVHFLLKKGA